MAMACLLLLAILRLWALLSVPFLRFLIADTIFFDAPREFHGFSRDAVLSRLGHTLQLHNLRVNANAINAFLPSVHDWSALGCGHSQARAWVLMLLIDNVCERANRVAAGVLYARAA